MIEFTVKPSGPGPLLEVFQSQFQFQFLWLVNSSLFHLGRLYFSKNLSVSSRFLFYWRISVVSVDTSPFSFLILLFWILSLFFLLSLTKGLSTLLIFSKSQLLFSLIYGFLHFYFSDFCSDLYDFFPSPNFRFCPSLLRCFRCKVILFFELFLVSWDGLVLL